MHSACWGFENQAWRAEDIVRQIKKHIEKLLEQQKKVVLFGMDTYVGVRMEEIISLAKALGAD